MSYSKIIALDLGKFKTVACVMCCADRSHVFETIDMSPANVHDLIVRHATPVPADTLVVLETCDTAGWVHDVCVAVGRDGERRPRQRRGVAMATRQTQDRSR